MPKVLPIPSGGAHSGRGRRVSSTLAEINIIPLVDVMLVLLIIFMVAAPMMQQGLNVNLPQQRRAPAIPQTKDPIYVTVPVTFARNQLVQLGEETIRLTVLSERIRQLVQNRDDKTIFLRSDGAVTMQQVMNVMDSLKAGGIERVAIISQPASR